MTDATCDAHHERVNKAITEQHEVIDEMKKRGLLVPKQPKQHPAAKALAGAVDGVEPMTWHDKVCTPGSPEREQWSKELNYRREHPAIDPNADDQFAGEGT